MAQQKTYDAIVIGAGVAGLAAARKLAGAGKRIAVIEARERIGGRIHTLHLADSAVPVELGAEFIHGDNATTFSIVDAAPLHAYELPDTHWWADGEEWRQIGDFWSFIDRLCRRIPAGARDRSFSDFLRTQKLSPFERALALSFVEGYHASHADRISAQALRSADSEQTEQPVNRQFRIANGYDALAAWLRGGLDPDHATVRLGTIVTEVRWRERAVEVDCVAAAGGAESTLRARTALVTLPIGVWKAPREQRGAVRFVPELTDKERALERLEAGNVVKIVFRFREHFWPELVERQPFNYLHSADRFVPTWWTMAPARVPMLTAWAGGSAADALHAEGSEAIVDRAIESMTAAFRTRRRTINDLLIGAHMHDWQSDPFSRGAYSYAGVGGRDAHAQLAKPVRNTLFFAGEATNGEETGTVAGAIDSGHAAAARMLRALA